MPASTRQKERLVFSDTAVITIIIAFGLFLCVSSVTLLILQHRMHLRLMAQQAALVKAVFDQPRYIQAQMQTPTQTLPPPSQPYYNAPAPTYAPQSGGYAPGYIPGYPQGTLYAQPPTAYGAPPTYAPPTIYAPLPPLAPTMQPYGVQPRTPAYTRPI